MFGNFCSHVNEKEKEIENVKNIKKGVDTWRRGSYPQNLVWIHATFFEFTDGRMTDACTTTVADKVKQS